MASRLQRRLASTHGAGNGPIREKRNQKLYEKRIRFVSLLAVAPSLGAASILIAQQRWAWELRMVLIVTLVLLSLGLELLLSDQAIRRLRTITNVISSLREGDFSLRSRGASARDALGELAVEVNALADALAGQQVRAIESTALLRRVVEEIDVPLFTFDPKDRLRLVNSAGERLLQQSAAQLLGMTADEIGLSGYLESEGQSLSTAGVLNASSRWLVRRVSFREQGLPHTLVVLQDVSRALREEERSAWQRLIRVLGHELNNSLTPITSIAGTLIQRLSLSSLTPEERQHFQKGLGIIESRSASLNRFLQAYRQLAQMPCPKRRPVALRSLLERAAVLEQRIPVTVHDGPEFSIEIDPDQCEQMLINLIRNGTDAALSAESSAGESPRVMLRYQRNYTTVVIDVVDNGPGFLNPENAFVPFYTTKSGGAGIGLVLSRQIAEAHGGSMVLFNREDAEGCIVRVILPLRGSATFRVAKC